MPPAADPGPLDGVGVGGWGLAQRRLVESKVHCPHCLNNSDVLASRCPPQGLLQCCKFRAGCELLV